MIPFIFLFLFAFGFGVGPIPWFLAPEAFPVQIRPLTQSIMAVSNWVLAFAAMRLAPELQHFEWYIGFGVCTVGATVFGLFFIKNPEAQAREDLHKNIFEEFIKE
jgi:hypothetical protein